MPAYPFIYENSKMHTTHEKGNATGIQMMEAYYNYIIFFSDVFLIITGFVELANGTKQGSSRKHGATPDIKYAKAPTSQRMVLKLERFSARVYRDVNDSIYAYMFTF